MRQDTDALGATALPEGSLYGVHTARAVANFPVSGQSVAPELLIAYAWVKAACALANQDGGHLDATRTSAIVAACREIAAGRHDEQFPVDALQGGAGTSTNMNVNEVVANRALQLMGRQPGDHEFLSPLGHVNLHQSTNDTYSTALRVAALTLLKELETATTHLQDALQAKEAAFAHVVKVGRTELMDAVPMTLGMTFGTFAEAVARDRWRIFKCRERIKQVVLLGDQAPRILSDIDGLVPLEKAASMEEAVQLCRKAAAAGDIVLLSPGCASFDLFKSYAQRGEVFAECVKKLTSQTN